jgi:uncharacterized membrane protein YeaQ/YmgE (transglycosylase-associated protein family)
LKLIDARRKRMDLIITIVAGGIIGWLASMIMKTSAQMGILANVIVGIVGSSLGFWLAGVDLHPEGARDLQVGSRLGPRPVPVARGALRSPSRGDARVGRWPFNKKLPPSLARFARTDTRT